MNQLVIKILKKDFLRKKTITVVVFAFILLSALLVASGVSLIVDISNSLNFLFDKAEVPHFVQMHTGSLDQAEIERWTMADSRIQAQQTMEMITVSGNNLFLGDNQTPEASSIMDISFVQQNTAFDFLLDLENQTIDLLPGQVGVPIYYRQEQNMKVGDKVQLQNELWAIELTIAAFVRDAQMNPAIVHSKRFLVNEADYATIHKQFPETEYLIEFLLFNPDELGAFSNDYLLSNLPKKGPSVDYGLFKILNGLTDGIVSGAIILLSLLIMVISVLCLRFTILATLEEDIKEIGVMKAIGIAGRDIRRIYLSKYIVGGALAALLGYLASFFLNQTLSANIMLYVGKAPKSIVQHILPLGAVVSILLMVLISCTVVLRHFNRISAVEALRSGNIGEQVNVRRFQLNRSTVPKVNLFLGFKDIFQRVKLFWLLVFVFFFCAAIILIPVHFLTTMDSPTFISYMGIGRSDLRIDLRQSQNTAERFEDMIAYLETDANVEQFAPLITSQFTLLQSDGSRENINVETGDFSLFPLDYAEGVAPTRENEIALSVLNAQEMEKSVGDKIVLLVDGQEKELTVSGIYQDVTNGGRTAKARFLANPESVLWYSVSLDLKSSSQIEEKSHEYAEAFHPARVTDLEGYVAQTLGNTIEQLRKVTTVSVIVGLSVSILITSLFLNMLIAKDAPQIAVMRSIGFTLHHIRIQYLTRALFLLSMGIALGTLFSNSLGPQLVSMFLASMGASQIKFIIDPIQAYLLFPLLLMTVVSVTTLVSIRGIKESSIAQMIME